MIFFRPCRRGRPKTASMQATVSPRNTHGPVAVRMWGRTVDWLAQNITRYGGDPKRIFLLGHSAGATHAATWTFMKMIHGANGPGVAGVMLISGVYAALHPQFSSDTPRPNQFAYYGSEVDKWAAMAPFGHIEPGHPPAFIIASEHEPYYFSWPSVALLGALVRCDRRMPWHKFLPGHNHVSSALQINSEVDTLGPDLLQFIERAGQISEASNA